MERGSDAPRQRHMLFKSPSFSQHGGEIAMRLSQRSFPTRKLIIKRFLPLLAFMTKSTIPASRHNSGTIVLSPHLDKLANKKRPTTGFSPITTRVIRQFKKKKKNPPSSLTCVDLPVSVARFRGWVSVELWEKTGGKELTKLSSRSGG